VEPIVVSSVVSRHASDGNSLAPYPPPPMTRISGNLSYVVTLSRTLAPITNPSSLIIASAASVLPSI